MDTAVRQLVERIQQELQPVNTRILSHPYLRALEAGQIGRDGLRLFAAQQAHILDSDLRSVAFMVTRARSESSRDFFLELLEGERAARQALGLFAAVLASAPATPGAEEPLPGAFAYSAYVAWLGLYASEAEFAGALLVNLPVWGTNCGRMAEALKAVYHLTDTDIAFFTLFASTPSGFEGRAAGVVAEGLAHGIAPAQIRRAATLLQSYELLFWDTLTQVSTKTALT